MSGRIPQSRAERIIAVGRLFLALSSYGAIYFDPLEPSLYAMPTYGLLAAYAFYALVVAIWTAVSPVTTQRWQIITHVADLVFFGTINYTTFGPTSPFFVYFVFAIICAMLRFGQRGTIYTTATAMAVFIASGIGRLQSTEFELNRFIIRLAYLTVVASMLVYLAAYHERLQHDLQRIARWPRSTRGDHRELLAHLMEEAASIFGARRVLLAYAHLQERFAYLGSRDEDGFTATIEPQSTANALLDHDAGTYISSAAMQSVNLDDSLSARAAPEPRGLPPEIVQRYDVDEVVATSFKGDFVRGRLLLLDGSLPLLEELNLARIAGGVIAGRLDHFHAAQRLQMGAVAEERIRVARDLHDSVLQLLTGAALQLRTLPRLMGENPDEMQKRLTEIGQVLATGQKELRLFIEELRPGTPREDALLDRLTSLAQRFRDQWALEVENEVAPVVHLLPISTRYEIYAIVNEAVANAAKHASAKRVSVEVDADDHAVSIDIADDGKGFPFTGRYSLDDLNVSRRGPVTLKERVGALGGTLILDSSATGTRLEIRLPLRTRGV